MLIILNTEVLFAQTKPTVVVLYTKSVDHLEDFENLLNATAFALEQYNKIHNTTLAFNFVEIDDKDNPLLAQKQLGEVIKKEKPIVILGPTYSNVGLRLKEFVNKNEIPMISIFATHNYLTKDAPYVFRVCASNKSLVKTLVSHLTPQIQKHKLSVTVFKDLSDFYSTDLADTFSLQLNEALDSNVTINEVLFKGLDGLEKLKDINSKAWNVSSKEILFLPTQDNISSRILTAMESAPYMVGTIEPVNFAQLFRKFKKVKTHIRMVSTVQWLPGKTDFSKKIEAEFKSKFKKTMKIPSALTFDATFAFLSAFERSQKKGISIKDALKDGTKVEGLTGQLSFNSTGERVQTQSFIKEDLLK